MTTSSGLVGWSLALATSSCTLADFNQLARDPYALDSRDRTAPSSGPRCQPESLVRYRGTWLALAPPSDVAPTFAPRLERFEQVLVQIGQQVYGRPPKRLLHAGTYACREVADRSARLSEHALGNAIDVTGFYFPALESGRKKANLDLPVQLRAPFTVTVLRDYQAPERSTPLSEYHQRFFALLRQALADGDLFRGVIGPPDPAHRSHFHLDMAPWVYRRIGTEPSSPRATTPAPR